MKYYRNIFLILLTIFFPLAAAAEPVATWGGFIDSSTETQVTDEFNYAFDAGVWLESHFSDNAVLEAKTTYQFDLDRYYFADLNRLVFSGSLSGASSSFEYRFGRFSFSDFSKYVLAHKLDGAEFSFGFPWGTVVTEAGYSGLNFVPNSTILITQSDAAKHISAPSHGYELAPPKIIEQIHLSFPQLFLQQDITVSLIAQQDMQEESKLINEGDRIFTEYLGIETSGSLKEDIYQKLYGFMNYGHGAHSTLAYLIGGELSYYMEEIKFSRLKIRALYSSGDSKQSGYYGNYSGSGYSNHFIPISNREHFGMVFSPYPGNISVGSASYSLKPVRRTASVPGELQIEVTALTFLRNTTGAISKSGVNSNSDKFYLGSEADLSLNYRPFSDLGISLSGGLFLPNNYSEDSPFYGTRPDVEAAARLNVSLAY